MQDSQDLGDPEGSMSLFSLDSTENNNQHIRSENSQNTLVVSTPVLQDSGDSRSRLEDTLPSPEPIESKDLTFQSDRNEESMSASASIIFVEKRNGADLVSDTQSPSQLILEAKESPESSSSIVSIDELTSRDEDVLLRSPPMAFKDSTKFGQLTSEQVLCSASRLFNMSENESFEPSPATPPIPQHLLDGTKKSIFDRSLSQRSSSTFNPSSFSHLIESSHDDNDDDDDDDDDDAKNTTSEPINGENQFSLHFSPTQVAEGEISNTTVTTSSIAAPTIPVPPVEEQTQPTKSPQSTRRRLRRIAEDDDNDNGNDVDDDEEHGDDQEQQEQSVPLLRFDNDEDNDEDNSVVYVSETQQQNHPGDKNTRFEIEQRRMVYSLLGPSLSQESSKGPSSMYSPSNGVNSGGLSGDEEIAVVALLDASSMDSVAFAIRDEDIDEKLTTHEDRDVEEDSVDDTAPPQFSSFPRSPAFVMESRVIRNNMEENALPQVEETSSDRKRSRNTNSSAKKLARTNDAQSPRSCDHCHATTTSQWRRSLKLGMSLCNACYAFTLSHSGTLDGRPRIPSDQVKRVRANGKKADEGVMVESQQILAPPVVSSLSSSSTNNSKRSFRRNALPKEAISTRKRVGLFSRISFIFTGIGDDEPIHNLITDNGGIIWDTFPFEHFSSPSIGSVSIDSIDNNDIDVFYILIAKTFRRTQKYLSALASGVLCIKSDWIETCVQCHELVSPIDFILPAGEALVTPPLDGLRKFKQSLKVQFVDKYVNSPERNSTSRRKNSISSPSLQKLTKEVPIQLDDGENTNRVSTRNSVSDAIASWPRYRRRLILQNCYLFLSASLKKEWYNICKMTGATMCETTATLCRYKESIGNSRLYAHITDDFSTNSDEDDGDEDDGDNGSDRAPKHATEVLRLPIEWVIQSIIAQERVDVRYFLF